MLVRLSASAPNPGGASLGSSAGLYLLAALIVGTLMSVVIVFARGKRRSVEHHEGLATDVGVGLELLRTRVAALDALTPAGPAAVALTDARGRLGAAQALRAEGSALPLLRAVRHAVLEGLAAAAEGLRLAGGDPGSPVPPPSSVPTIDSSVRVPVRGVLHLAHPSYEPGFPYFFPGGVFGEDEVPGAWYAAPFWLALLTEPQAVTAEAVTPDAGPADAVSPDAGPADAVSPEPVSPEPVSRDAVSPEAVSPASEGAGLSALIGDPGGDEPTG